jgi:hypothetical protein
MVTDRYHSSSVIRNRITHDALLDAKDSVMFSRTSESNLHLIHLSSVFVFILPSAIIGTQYNIIR